MAKLHQVVKHGQFRWLQLTIEQVALNHVRGRMPLLLLLHELALLELRILAQIIARSLLHHEHVLFCDAQTALTSKAFVLLLIIC